MPYGTTSVNTSHVMLKCLVTKGLDKIHEIHMVTCAILHWMKYVGRWKINIVIATSQSCVTLIALISVRLIKLSMG